jgi:hypothetical protein
MLCAHWLCTWKLCVCFEYGVNYKLCLLCFVLFLLFLFCFCDYDGFLSISEVITISKPPVNMTDDIC